MKVRVNDNVKIIAGKDKGKEGKVIQTLKKKDKVIVEGINIVTKHFKPDAQGNNGGIRQVEAPIHVSNVKVLEQSKEKKVTKKAAKEQTKEEKREAN